MSRTGTYSRAVTVSVKNCVIYVAVTGRHGVYHLPAGQQQADGGHHLSAGQQRFMVGFTCLMDHSN